MKLILATFLFLSQFAFSQVEKVGNTKVLKEQIQWEAFDTASSVDSSKITPGDLEGKWRANKGAYFFDGNLAGMNLTKPFELVIKGNEYKRNSKEPFEGYTLEANRIIGLNSPKTNIGIINKITPHSLTITWKSGANYTRYYFER